MTMVYIDVFSDLEMMFEPLCIPGVHVYVTTSFSECSVKSMLSYTYIFHCTDQYLHVLVCAGTVYSQLYHEGLQAHSLLT